ncbi:interleukin-26 [Alosa pseudoharengus]|uniref:interleukin-26 n=1 Tax=Alosa pseudoharengus TaxID=34774 RepID=UPI003F895E49
MRTKLVTVFALLATLCCSQGCTQKKRVQLECNLSSVRSVTKNMMATIKGMQNSIKDDNPDRKLLKKFTKPCRKKGVDLPVIIDILDIYKTYIFSKMDEMLLIKLENLQDTLEHCVFKLSANQHSKNKTSRTKKNVRSLEKTFKKLDKSDFYKAVLEFKTVLVWISMFQGRDE